MKKLIILLVLITACSGEHPTTPFVPDLPLLPLALPIDLSPPTILPPPTMPFDIELVYFDSISNTHKDRIEDAVRYMESVIGQTPRQSPITITSLPTSDTLHCTGGTPVSMSVDGLVVAVTIDDRYFAAGGVCRRHSLDPNLPAVGRLYLSNAFLTRDANLDFERTIRHELIHILGFGPGKGWDRNRPYFPGPLAVAAFDSLGGSSYEGDKVPTAGGSAAYYHWS